MSLQEKQKLLDEIEDLTVQLTEEQEKKRKMGDKLSQERHQFQKEKESTQEVSRVRAASQSCWSPKLGLCGEAGLRGLSKNRCKWSISSCLGRERWYSSIAVAILPGNVAFACVKIQPSVSASANPVGLCHLGLFPRAPFLFGVKGSGGGSTVTMARGASRR